MKRDAPPPEGDLQLEVRRMHVGVLTFYTVDALLLSLFGASGTVSPLLGFWYAVAGYVSTEAGFCWFYRRGGRFDDREALCLGLTASTGLVMLATLCQAPQVGGLMMMSMMALLALSALQLSLRHQLMFCVLLAVGSVAILGVTQGSAGVPTAHRVERILSGVWLAWLMAKASVHNVTGTRLRNQVKLANDRLAQALQALEQVAATDELTLLPNRRAILACLEAALAADPRRGGPVGVALLDIDRFKRINDSGGHAVGDQVLREFGRVVALGLRPTDQLGRYGGEEFLLVLREFDDSAAAVGVVERLCAAVVAHDWSRIAPGLAVTVSAGVTLLVPGESAAEAIRRGDAALYLAKERGRNRVVDADAPCTAACG